MRVVLFGAGERGQKVFKSGCYEVAAVIDNDSRKQGGFFCGKPIISLETYKREYLDCHVLISNVRAKEAEEQLIANNIMDFSIPPEAYKVSDVPTDERIAHGNWIDYLVELCDKPGMRVLEVGSREVSGDLFRDKFHLAAYVGFDYYPGANVDVVGDAHRLSSYFDEPFDLIFSSAVFEHLALPWMAAIEIVKLLKKDGYVFIETHYSYKSHERPWHFFQFSENALDVLFPQKFGMRCVRKGCSSPIEGRFSEEAADYLQGRLVPGLYCHSEYLGQKVEDVEETELDWSKISLEDVRKGTEYPKE